MAVECPDAPGRLRVPHIICATLGALVASYVMLALFMWRLGFQFMRDDVGLYWQDSFDWKAAFNGLYAPLYLWVLALVRTITLGLIPPIPLMMTINLVCLLACGWLIYRIGIASGVSSELSAAGALLFGWWPLAGLPYTVYPKTDIPAMTIYLGGVSLFLKDRRWAGSTVIGIAMLAHQVMWPLGPLTIAASWLSDRARFGTRGLVGMMLVVVLPLGLLLVAGAIVTGTFTWTLGGNMRHIESRGHLPILDGAIGTFMRGNLTEIIKGLIISGIAVLSGILACFGYRQKWVGYPVGIAICLVIIALWFVLNSFEIWGMVRFSRLLALPLMWVAAGRLKENLFATRRGRATVATFLAVLLLSQFVYAWYMVRVFFV